MLSKMVYMTWHVKPQCPCNQSRKSGREVACHGKPKHCVIMTHETSYHEGVNFVMLAAHREESRERASPVYVRACVTVFGT